MSDAIRDKFNEVEAKIKGIVPTKRIIQDGKLPAEFTANGTKYFILPIDKVFTVERMVAYQNLELMFASSKTPYEIKKAFLEFKDITLNLMHEGTRKQATEKLLRHSLNCVDSFKGEFTSRYPMALYICTLFIVKEGEDFGKWDFETADSKIEDWSKERLNMVDFLAIAQTVSKGCQEIINEK